MYFLGGACTAAYVVMLPVWNLTLWKSESGPLIDGIAQELINNLNKVGGTIKPAEAQNPRKTNPILPHKSTCFPLDF